MQEINNLITEKTNIIRNGSKLFFVWNFHHIYDKIIFHNLKVMQQELSAFYGINLSSQFSQLFMIKIPNKYFFIHKIQILESIYMHDFFENVIGRYIFDIFNGCLNMLNLDEMLDITV